MYQRRPVLSLLDRDPLRLVLPLVLVPVFFDEEPPLRTDVLDPDFLLEEELEVEVAFPERDELDDVLVEPLLDELLDDVGFTVLPLRVELSFPTRVLGVLVEGVNFVLVSLEVRVSADVILTVVLVPEFVRVPTGLVVLVRSEVAVPCLPSVFVGVDDIRPPSVVP